MSEKRKGISLSELKNASSVFKYILPYKWSFIFGMILLVVSTFVVMIFPGAAGEMSNVAIGEGKFGLDLQDFFWLFLTIILIQGLFSYLRVVLFANVSERGMADVRKDVYRKIMSQDYIFFEERRVGELVARLTTDVEQLQNAFSITLAEFIRQIFTLIIGISILFYLAPGLSLILLLTLPVIIVIAVVFGRYIKKLSKERQDKLAETNVVLDETFQAINVVKTYTTEYFELKRYSGSVDNVVTVALRFAKTKGLFIVFIITILFGGLFFILWRGALLVQSGVMPVGDLISFIIYTGFIGGAMAGLGNLYTQLAGAIGATERIQDILKLGDHIDIEKSADRSKYDLSGDIIFNTIDFNYPSRKEVPVLKNVSIHVKEGQKIALVGGSGSGKSTLVKLLLKFYELNKGTITINNVDIADIDSVDLRQNIGVVPQEVTLFGGSIRENILYGDPRANDEAVMQAAIKANAWEFIKGFPEGLDTIVGERGMKLSGGQRQRIAISRAILKDPKILVLDEATSSLDAESERLVQEALEKLMEGRTSIIIAHRLATIKDVDKIFVLDHGAITESGTHDELIKIQNGIYHKLAALQFDID